MYVWLAGTQILANVLISNAQPPEWSWIAKWKWLKISF